MNQIVQSLNFIVSEYLALWWWRKYGGELGMVLAHTHTHTHTHPHTSAVSYINDSYVSAYCEVPTTHEHSMQPQ
jgi:hypothetical protein